MLDAGAEDAPGHVHHELTDCASECNNKDGCLGFNNFVERDPILTPGPNCQNSDALANIKYLLWGNQVYTDTANNKGQWRE